MIIVSGPSTIGKNPFIYKACNLFELDYIVPCTTRSIRSEEVEGQDYNFMTIKDFQKRIKDKTILEWDYCLENYYGYSFDFPGGSKKITHGLSRMALRIKGKYPNNITTIFFMPDYKEAIINNVRKIYNGKDLFFREALIEEEIVHSVLFDRVFTVKDSVFDLLKDPEMINILKQEKERI